MQGPLGADDALYDADVHAQDRAIQEDQGAEGLVLSGSRHVEVSSEVGEKGRHMLLPHLFGMTNAVEEDEAASPLEVCLLRAVAVVAQAERLSDSVQQLRLSRLAVDHPRGCGRARDRFAWSSSALRPGLTPGDAAGATLGAWACPRSWRRCRWDARRTGRRAGPAPQDPAVRPDHAASPDSLVAATIRCGLRRQPKPRWRCQCLQRHLGPPQPRTPCARHPASLTG